MGFIKTLALRGMLTASASNGETVWCAELMASSEPWITLRRDRASALAQVADRSKELFIATDADRRLGFVLIDMRGPFTGYVQSLCVSPEFRNRGYGAMLLRFAEKRILRDEQHIFLCVSSFNAGAQRFYERHGYEHVGALPNHIVEGAAEIIMRKSKDGLAKTTLTEP
ncbi:MAG TPA: GNAT family N-acetyltransferase [Silvibacterium sp.]|nr:GNAT family N-acetyltransferase [Silvibacterium sp.]